MALKAMLNPPFFDIMSDKNLLVVLGRRSGNESFLETNYFNPDELPAQQPSCIRCTAATECGPVTIVLERLVQQQTYFIFEGTCTSMVMTQPESVIML